MECPFGCSHHDFPNHFNFCPYCGSKLVIVYNKKSLHIKNPETHKKKRNKREHKKDLIQEFPELHSLVKGD